MSAAPTFSQIRAQVASIRRKLPGERVIGIRSPGRWTGESLREDGGNRYRIEQCDSPLAMRMVLRESSEEDTIKVLVTSLEDTQVGEDVLLRLAKRRLFPIDAWQIVQTSFQAHSIDPRLTQCSWMAELLLDLAPANGFPAARAGFLDSETVWPILLRHTIGLDALSLDLTALLKWSSDAEGTKRFRQCGTSLREGAIGWLAEKAGPAAELVMRCIERLDLPDAVPVGLVAGVVFHPTATGKLEKASGKLEEGFLGGRTPDPHAIDRWSHSAAEVIRFLRHTEDKAYWPMLKRSDEILRKVQADAFAYLSDVSQLGFDQRLARFGRGLKELLERRAWGTFGDLVEAAKAVHEHDMRFGEAERVGCVVMALRLARWLAARSVGSETSPKSLAEAAAEHLQEGGFVDWARLSLQLGDPVSEASDAYACLFEEVTKVREEQARHFAKLLVDWSVAGSKGDEVLRVEHILEKVVAPIAAQHPVLLVVIDGMSAAVSRELVESITRQEWVALCESGRGRNRPGIATIPSVTECSRASLLCGTHRQGASADERVGFAEHGALLAVSKSGQPPILFHKATLQDSGGTALASEVRLEIGSMQRRVVGVVVNAVDDHLLKGDQINTRWTRDAIKVLPSLLHEARMAHRIVVLVSDHGHVLDRNTEFRPSEGGERWRIPDGPVVRDEMEIAGHRVLADHHRLVAPWSERVRYSVKKNGYHGGLNPQEMVIPIVVLSSDEVVPSGWEEQPVDVPAWWDDPMQVEQASVAPLPKLKPLPSVATGSLFDPDPRETTVTVENKDPSLPEWVARLLASAIFAEQKKLGGRTIPADEEIARLLRTLDDRGGKMTTLALARTLQFPEVRLPGFLAKVQRILNLDGYAVLARDDASDTVELHRELLLKQFDLV